MSLLAKTKYDSVTAEALLGIPETRPEALFSAASAAQVKSEYRELAKLWHTDHNTHPLAKEAFQRLQSLYTAAKAKLAANKWELPNLLQFTDQSGKKYQMKYRVRHAFELGEMYVGDKTLIYTVNKTERQLFDNAKDIITKLSYPTDDMKKRMSPYMPRLRGTYETDDSLVMALDKDPDAILLSDLLKHKGGKVEPEHAAWMMSRMHNIACYLSWAGLTHNAITTENCFIFPKDHAIGLYGGWWYAAREGQKLKALPPKSADIAPPSLFDNPVATKRLDQSMIRATAREILGDATGMSFIKNKDIPQPITQWVNGASSGDPNDDYRIWSKTILTKAFGARRFVEMKLTPNDIYQP